MLAVLILPTTERYDAGDFVLQLFSTSMTDPLHSLRSFSAFCLYNTIVFSAVLRLYPTIVRGESYVLVRRVAILRSMTGLPVRYPDAQPISALTSCEWKTACFKRTLA